MLHSESRNHTLVHVYPHQFNRSQGLCYVHGWHGRCEPLCTQVSVAPAEAPCYGDVSVPSTPRPEENRTRRLLLRAATAAATDGAEAVLPGWRGKILRVRAFVKDGFYVRVHFVLTQGIWAAMRGIPFFVHLNAGASCSKISSTCKAETRHSHNECMRTFKTCDAYSDGNGWEEYFEPINGISTDQIYRTVDPGRIVELDCQAAWYFNQGVLGGHTDVGIYAQDWKVAHAFRQRNAALVAAWVRVRADIRAQADAEWRRVVPRGAGPVIGVHLRGTDKFVMPKVSPARYYALIDAFMERHGGSGAAGAPGPLIYLATDDATYQAAVVRRYGAHRVAQLFDGRVSRATGKQAIWKTRGSADDASAHSRGLEVLLDTLLLARCDFLLKPASSVSEFALYFNPRLVNHSFDFELEGQPEPEWARGSGEDRSPSRLLHTR